MYLSTYTYNVTYSNQVSISQKPYNLEGFKYTIEPTGMEDLFAHEDVYDIVVDMDGGEIYYCNSVSDINIDN